MLIEAAKGGHTNVVQVLLDYPHSIMMSSPHAAGVQVPQVPPTGLHEVPEAVRVLPQEELQFNAKAASLAGKVLCYFFNKPSLTSRNITSPESTLEGGGC